MIKSFCKVCETEMNLKDGREARRKFCSSKCRTFYYNRNMGGRTNFCIDCKTKISLKSTKCYNCSIKKRDLTGKNNGRWKGGTSEGYQLRIYTSVLKDNGININMCGACGITKKQTKKMCIHHIDKNHKNNSIENLIPLCAGCHTKFHIDPVKMIHKICVYCKKQFETEYYKEYRKFCSRKCSNRYYNFLRKGKPRKMKGGIK